MEASLRVAANLDQSGVALHLEVTRDARLVHADLLDQLAHGPLAVSDRVEDPTAGRLGDDIEHSERGRHLLGIRQSVYMGQRTYLWAPSLEPGLWRNVLTLTRGQPCMLIGVPEHVGTGPRWRIEAMSVPLAADPVIRVRGLAKALGDLEVLREVDLDVGRGSVLALLGSNGAGKDVAAVSDDGEHHPGLGWGRGVAEGACHVLAGHSDGGSVVVVGRRRLFGAIGRCRGRCNR